MRIFDAAGLVRSACEETEAAAAATTESPSTHERIEPTTIATTDEPPEPTQAAEPVGAAQAAEPAEAALAAEPASEALTRIFMLPPRVLVFVALSVAACGGPSQDARDSRSGGMNGALMLRVRPMQPAPLAPGRLVVAWVSIYKDEPPFREIGYDVPFLGTEQTVTIPYADIRPPSRMTQPHACKGDSCAPPGSVPGFVLVIPASNGPLGPAHSLKIATGAARVILGVRTIWKRVERSWVPDKVPRGYLTYGLERSSSWDKPVRVPSETVFDLVVCPDDPSCHPPVPNPD